MDTTKITPEQEREIRFNAWKENLSKEIDEQATLISSVISAISNPEISVESKKTFLRIGANAVAQYDNLTRIYSDALTAKTLKK